MKFLTFAFFCWPKLDISTFVEVKYDVSIVTSAALCSYLVNHTCSDRLFKQLVILVTKHYF